MEFDLFGMRGHGRIIYLGWDIKNFTFCVFFLKLGIITRDSVLAFLSLYMYVSQKCLIGVLNFWQFIREWKIFNQSKVSKGIWWRVRPPCSSCRVEYLRNESCYFSKNLLFHTDFESWTTLLERVLTY